jgi:adenylate cyclase
VETYDVAEAAERAGISVPELRRLVELGIIEPDGAGEFTGGHLRKIGVVTALMAAGIPLDGLGAAIRQGRVTLDFLDAIAFERFSSASGVTFAEMAERTGVPIEQLLFIREAAGSSRPQPSDRIREEELPFAALIELAVEGGLRPSAIQQMLRSQADGMRRVAETESNTWHAEVIAPAMARGMRPDQVLGGEFGDRMSAATERAVIAMYHMQQMRAWTTNIIESLEAMLADAGLHTRSEHPPAMCFLDISGYTRLTEERGDAAAAELAEDLGRLVQRECVKHGGRAVKWLGDGVMLHFPNPGHGVSAALDMVDGVADAGLPPAHVGLHAGPVIFQEGDYYGRTVNLAARIAGYAQPGQVLVSQALVDLSTGPGLAFTPVGPVELKGVAGATDLFAAHRPY